MADHYYFDEDPTHPYVKAEVFYDALTLVDGAMEVVALFGANGIQSQKHWAKEWTEKAAKLGASFD